MCVYLFEGRGTGEKFWDKSMEGKKDIRCSKTPKCPKVTNFLFLASEVTANGDFVAIKLKDACSLEGELWQT